MIVALGNAVKISCQITPSKTALPNSLRPRNRRRTHLSTTELLDKVYEPAFRVNSRYGSYFKPTFLTDENGEISKELEPDIYRDHSASRKSGQL